MRIKLPSKLVQFAGLGFGLTVIAGFFLTKTGGISKPAMWLLAACIVYLAGNFAGITILKKPKAPPAPAWVPEAPEGSVPRYGSRRWARANFHSGIISIEELNAFYVAHPEDTRDPDR